MGNTCVGMILSHELVGMIKADGDNLQPGGWPGSGLFKEPTGSYVLCKTKIIVSQGAML